MLECLPFTTKATPYAQATLTLALPHNTYTTPDLSIQHELDNRPCIHQHGQHTPSRESTGYPSRAQSKFVADTEERIVLGRRFVEARKDKSLPLKQCFDSAVALHALSMTCHQMLEEFQSIHHSSTSHDARWVLIVNNFDFDQIEAFWTFLHHGEFFRYNEEEMLWLPPLSHFLDDTTD